MENSLNKIKSLGFLENALNAFDEPFYVICVADYSIVLANKAARVLGIETAHTCHMLTHRKSTPCKGEEHSCSMDLVIHSRQPYVYEYATPAITKKVSKECDRTMMTVSACYLRI